MKNMRLDDIKIRDSFASSRPSEEKMQMKKGEYIRSGKLKPIMIDENNVLIDGYISYLILKEFGVENTTVIIKEKDNLKKFMNKSTYYIYGIYKNAGKEYSWFVPNGCIDGFIGKALPGDKVLVNTRNGNKRVTITRIVLLDNPPVKQRIRKVIKLI